MYEKKGHDQDTYVHMYVSLLYLLVMLEVMRYTYIPSCGSVDEQE